LLIYLKIINLKRLASITSTNVNSKDLKRSSVLLLSHSFLFFIFIIIGTLSRVTAILSQSNFTFLKINLFVFYFELIAYQTNVIVNAVLILFYLKAYQSIVLKRCLQFRGQTITMMVKPVQTIHVGGPPNGALSFITSKK
jgi:hypothetical protein